MAKDSIGGDYGTLAGRALLLNLETGEELASAVCDYPHGVMDREMPWGEKLPPDWALQHPEDYLEVLYRTIPAVLKESGVPPEDIVGVGTDFTACTALPVRKDGVPLCFLPEFAQNPHAYVKLWKHHAAQDKADRITALARLRGEAWLQDYGGRVSSEWMFPKLWQLAEEAPELYGAMYRFVEAADWIVWQLTGNETCSACSAGYKAFWNQCSGYPAPDFFKALGPKMEHAAEKLGKVISPLGERAGGVTAEMAHRTGLREGTAVSVGNVDAHVCVPAAGISGPGKLLAILGTSTCHMVLGTEGKRVPGVCGMVKDGILPGYFGFEAGQSCVGDLFSWFLNACLPASCREEAFARGKSLHEYLREKAQKLKPGESGLLALDWWNGNRSILTDGDLTGLLLGMTLQTRPEELYRALIEATAYGTRILVENYREHGVPVEEFVAAGGISRKDPMTMQIYADVLNMPVLIVGTHQGSAFGSALFGAVAAGRENGGFSHILEAAERLGKRGNTVYDPIPEHTAVYDRLYGEYKQLHDYFGRGGSNVMKRLKALSREQKQKEQNFQP